ncbi:DnaJ-domain-containing protein [Coniophora puteana RWD-64-598 SS2]|uniref:DnaJ-domain-containing protein n=1 Tax=Coniophora puteana (strain RWD-64-598) TaxID=741705 RepID=A0A5M3N113_CONPW|nr:DnaJ-domain-containing protein [Coniophora puteana RWD-64-598 SS2]EIW85100.1 DnaJ-domain-containing protein [Coniophora puteana RWD-64-598 SS2]
MVRQATVSAAYATLGLQQGATLDNVKTAYKQLALKNHPDKNPGNEDATAQFQKLSEAYNILLKHLDSSSPPRRHYYPCGHSVHSDEDLSDDYDEYWYDPSNDDYDDYYDSDEEEEDMAFYMFLFSELLRGRSNRYSAQTFRSRYAHRPATPETEEQYQARLEKTRHAQEEAEARRARENADRRAAQERERQQERNEAAQRQKEKSRSKKQKEKVSREQAKTAAQNRQQRAQTLRSAAFTAIRQGDAERVKKAVWEDNVDPAGGEVKIGCETYVCKLPDDPKESMLHISATKGDASLIQWLDAHSADPEERNSQGFTAFHIALQLGHVVVLKYFYETYDPKLEESTAVYDAPPSRPLLHLALDSAEPEVVWMVLDKGLAPSQDIRDAWALLSSNVKEANSLSCAALHKDSRLREEMRNLLASFGGFTPPRTPNVTVGSIAKSPSLTSPRSDMINPSSSHDGDTNAKLGKEHSTMRPTAPREPTEQGESGTTQSDKPFGGRGRGRGRGYGRGWARGRGRG